MDVLPGPVPYFHQLFADVKQPLQEDFPVAGVARISSQSVIVGESESKKAAITVEHISDTRTKESSTSGFIKLRCPTHNNFYGGVKLANSSDAGFQLTPVAQFACPTSPHSIAVDLEKLVYYYAHPTFAIRAKTRFWEGVPVQLSAVTFLGSGYYAGVFVDYDALRSGLRKSLIAINHGHGTSCSGTLSVNGKYEFGLTWKKEIAARTDLLVDVLPSEDTAVVGIQHLTPCGKKVTLRLDAIHRSISAALQWTISGWNCGLSVTADEKDFKNKQYTPKIGINFLA